MTPDGYGHLQIVPDGSRTNKTKGNLSKTDVSGARTKENLSKTNISEGKTKKKLCKTNIFAAKPKKT